MGIYADGNCLKTIFALHKEAVSWYKVVLCAIIFLPRSRIWVYWVLILLQTQKGALTFEQIGLWSLEINFLLHQSRLHSKQTLLTLLSATCVFKSRVQKTDLSLLTELYLIPYRRRRAVFKISKGIRDTGLFHYDAFWHALKKRCDV